MTPNAELARRARALADAAGSAERAAPLVVAVALSESKTLRVAAKILNGWNGRPHTKTAALELLDQLAMQEKP